MSHWQKTTRTPWSTKPLGVGDRVVVRKGALRNEEGIIAEVRYSDFLYVLMNDKVFGTVSWPRANLRRIR